MEKNLQQVWLAIGRNGLGLLWLAKQSPLFSDHPQTVPFEDSESDIRYNSSTVYSAGYCPLGGSDVKTIFLCH
jgi:hypothetical protein